MEATAASPRATRRSISGVMWSTTTKAAFSGGSWPNSSFRVGGPPVETPITTTLFPLAMAGLSCRRPQGEEDGGPHPAARALGPDPAVGVGHDPPADGKPQPLGAEVVARGVGLEELPEDELLVPRLQPHAVVLDRDGDLVLARDGGDPDRAVFGGEARRVGEQVVEE